jgi:hypothetical protein
MKEYVVIINKRSRERERERGGKTSYYVFEFIIFN